MIESKAAVAKTMTDNSDDQLNHSEPPQSKTANSAQCLQLGHKYNY